MTRYMKLAVVVGVVFAGAALAELPSLPKELNLPQGKDSAGLVTFRHDSHVDSAKPRCLACHPVRFGILGRSGVEKGEPITHARMEKGEACGACHGKEAFGFDDCTSCHAQ